LSTADSKRWQRTSPLAAIFYIGRIVEVLIKNAAQSLAPLAVVIFSLEGNLFIRIALAVAFFAVVIVVGAILQYLFFRYRITDRSILIREGVFKKKQLDIKFDRIQAINTQQNIIYRYFGLVTVTLDTAGSSQQEGNLPAVKIALADSLRTRIRRERGIPAEGESNDEADDAQALLSLDNKDMVRIGLSSNRALIFLVFLGPILENVDDRIQGLIEQGAFNFITNGEDISFALGATLIILAIITFLLLLMLASILGAFLRYHRFTLVQDEDTLRSTGGLLTRHEHSINFSKVQSLEARQNLMLRWFRRFRMRAKQTSSRGEERGKHFVIPLCQPDDLPRLASTVFRDELPEVDLQPDSDVYQRISIRYFRSRLLIFGVFPALAVCGALLPLAGLYALFALLWIPIVASCAWVVYKKRGYFIGANGVLLRRGFVGYRTNAFLHRKVQRISVTQTPSQQRKGLATVRFFLASGTLKLPYVDHKMAKQLRDYVLYRVESSRLSWH
jgi:putative membrane protein